MVTRNLIVWLSISLFAFQVAEVKAQGVFPAPLPGRGARKPREEDDMGRKSQGEPQFTKATYDHKRPRFDPPSPDRVKAKLEQDGRDAANERRLRQRLKNDPISAIEESLGPIEEYIKRLK